MYAVDECNQRDLRDMIDSRQGEHTMQWGEGSRGGDNIMQGGRAENNRRARVAGGHCRWD